MSILCDLAIRAARAFDAWDATLSSYCDGPERDEARAAMLAMMREAEKDKD